MSWFDWRFFWKHCIWAIPFVAALLSRLWPIANPETSNAFSKSNLIALTSWTVANFSFMWTYFSYFSPRYVALQLVKDGGRDSVFSNHWPLYLGAFSFCFAAVAYFRMVWRHRHITYHVQEEPKFWSLARYRFAAAAPYMGQTLLYSFGLYVVVMLIVGRLPVLLATKLLPGSRFVDYRFFEFILDIRFFYHLNWAAVSLLAMYTTIGVIIEYIFGRSFRICESSAASQANPTIMLLGGLKSDRAAVSSQAVLELRSLLINEPLWRAALFRDFVGEEAASRILCTRLVNMLGTYKSSIDVMNKDLQFLSQQLTDRCNGQATDKAVPLPADNGIFSPRRRNVIEKILIPDSAVAPSGSLLSKESRPSIPDILEIKSQPKGLSLCKTSAVSRILYHNRYLDLVAFVFGRFIRSFPARVYAGLSCEIIKSTCLTDEQLVIWVIDALGHLVVASYDEDTHGQVQFVMDNVLGILIDLHMALEEFIFLPHINNKRLIDDLFGSTASPTERRARVVSTAALAALETIFDKFTDSLTQLKISGETREKLRAVGLCI